MFYYVYNFLFQNTSIIFYIDADIATTLLVATLSRFKQSSSMLEDSVSLNH